MRERDDDNPSSYKGLERRQSTFTVNKEISVGWLVTFLLGGALNFASIIWIAATLVSDVGSLKLLVNEHAKILEAQRQDKERSLISNITQDSRLNAHDQALVIHSERISGIEKRLYK